MLFSIVDRKHRVSTVDMPGAHACADELLLRNARAARSRISADVIPRDISIYLLRKMISYDQAQLAKQHFMEEGAANE